MISPISGFESTFIKLVLFRIVGLIIAHVLAVTVFEKCVLLKERCRMKPIKMAANTDIPETFNFSTEFNPIELKLF
jgi:hypothetical protein